MPLKVPLTHAVCFREPLKAEDTLLTVIGIKGKWQLTTFLVLSLLGKFLNKAVLLVYPYSVYVFYRTSICSFTWPIALLNIPNNKNITRIVE